jgi:hypothetical protein
LKDIVRKIQFSKDLTIAQIAESIGYSRIHLQKELKKERPSATVEKLLYDKYNQDIQYVSRETILNEPTHPYENKSPGVNRDYRDKYIESLEDQIKLLKDKVANYDAILKTLSSLDKTVLENKRLLSELLNDLAGESKQADESHGGRVKHPKKKVHQ